MPHDDCAFAHYFCYDGCEDGIKTAEMPFLTAMVPMQLLANVLVK